MNTFDNIAAPATGIGGAVSIIRISGPDALAIGRRVWRGRRELGPESRRELLLGRVGIDSALAVFMPGPASYTGDDVVELHCHGGQSAADQALRSVFAAGCRPAEPGEFTFRAFVNGKLDLAQAEAVNDVISAGSDLALRIAEKQLDGVLSRRLEAAYDELNALRAECESHLDFPDEELAWEPDVPARLEALTAQLRELYDTRDIGGALRDGVSVVLAGRPNAGKSSLLNRLLGYERAIVTPIPGTTRDTVEAQTVICNLPVRITDTAGLRESADPIEQMGVERSRKSIAAASVTFWLLDASGGELEAELAEMERADAGNRIAVWNKIDLVPERALPELPCPAVRISARTRSRTRRAARSVRRHGREVASSGRPRSRRQRPRGPASRRSARTAARSDGAFPRGGIRARRHRHPHGDEPGRRDHRQDRRAGHSRQYFQPLLHREIIFSWKRNRAISGRSF